MKTKAKIEKETVAFFCRACLEDKPAEEASPDPRYCRGCYDFLLREAASLDGRKPTWVPKDSQSITRTPQEPSCKPVEPVLRQDKSADKGNIPTMKMSTLRGAYKKRELPEDAIRQMHEAGLGSKAIATRLKIEHGIHVSYKTIQRLLIRQGYAVNLRARDTAEPVYETTEEHMRRLGIFSPREIARLLKWNISHEEIIQTACGRIASSDLATRPASESINRVGPPQGEGRSQSLSLVLE